MPNPIRQAFAEEAAKHGYTLDHADFRSGLFFLKRGTEVRTIGHCGRIPLSMVSNYVALAVRCGLRVDQIEGSRYFVEPHSVRP